MLGFITAMVLEVCTDDGIVTQDLNGILQGSVVTQASEGIPLR